MTTGVLRKEQSVWVHADERAVSYLVVVDDVLVNNATASYNKFNLNKFSKISSETGNLEIR